MVIALERDQQSKDEKTRMIAKLRILKNRWTGVTGPAGWIQYDLATTRYSEVFDNPFAEEEGSCSDDARDPAF